ncbi:MAG TPA: ABC transporter ATP-binding protein [Candidatus Limnocylindrales bacterium]|nr:ABC transporter ATP-binding protein [Candidatus Limnocylindrales bacterium]
MTEVIEAFGLTKSYGTRRGIVDVDFTVHEGEVFGFLGPNGAGKTTTIRTLLGLLRPTSGRATVFGLDIWADAPRVHEQISFLGSDPGYLGELTAAEQLDYVRRLRRLPKDAWRPMAERFELDPTVPIKKLSRGNRQKVGVVQAFMGDSPLLILDEPTTGLDPLMQREFLAVLSDVRAAGRTVFLSSHNLPEVERSCDRVGIIREGRLTEISTVQALLASHWRSVNLVLGETPPAGTFDLPNVQVASMTARDIHLMVRGDVNPLLRRIAELDVYDVSITTPEIEDVFLRFYEGTNAPHPDMVAEVTK